MNKSITTVYIASDHGGFELKQFLKEKLTDQAYAMQDLGPDFFNPSDDYPDYVKKVTDIMSAGEPGDTRGIVICRNGVGVSVYANRFRNIRCALSWNPKHVRSAREDDNVNMLALPADYLTKEEALQTVLAFLETPFSNEERHIRRLNKYGDTGNL